MRRIQRQRRVSINLSSRFGGEDGPVYFAAHFSPPFLGSISKPVFSATGNFFSSSAVRAATLTRTHGADDARTTDGAPNSWRSSAGYKTEFYSIGFE